MVERKSGALCSEAYSEWGVWDEAEYGHYTFNEKIAVVSEEDETEEPWDLLVRETPYSSEYGKS